MRDLPPYARYRVVSNIAAIHFNAGRNELALEFFRTAHALRPDDVNASTNLAFAELANGKRDDAATRAAEILSKHPGHGPAANVLLQARATDKIVSDPFSLVPTDSHPSADFKVGAIIFLRQHDNAVWKEMAARATAEHPESDYLRLFAAEAELEPILNDPEIMLGKQVESDVSVTISRCVTILKANWSQGITAEDINPEAIIPLAANLASAYRIKGEDTAAAEVLDQTLSKAGKDPVLLRARAILYLHDDNDNAAAQLLNEGIDDPEVRLFLAQILTPKEPDRALELVKELDPRQLRAALRPLIFEVQAEIAILKEDTKLLRLALEAHGATGGPFASRALLKARGHDARLFDEDGLSSVADAEGPRDDNALEDWPEMGLVPAHVKQLIRGIREHEASLSFADRLQVAQYMESQNVFDVASDLLDGRVQTAKDTPGLRTYLSSSIAAKLYARSQAVLSALPLAVAELPYFQRMAATHYWNSGDATAAAPFVEALYLASPARLELFLWHVDCLLRQGQQESIRKLLQEPIENTLEGTVSQKSRLARAFAAFGQPERALKLAYQNFVLNRNDPAAWMGLMSVALSGEDLEELDLRSEVIGLNYSFEVKLGDGSKRQYIIEVDEAVRNVEHDAIPPDHIIAQAVQTLKPGDEFAWPLYGGNATIIAAKHKYLAALHSAMERYNERFPDAKGFKQIGIKVTGEDAFEELRDVLVARNEYVSAQVKSYSAGKLSLLMLAHMTSSDPIEVMLGFKEVGVSYKVATGLAEERQFAFTAIDANGRKGCVIDAATYHCIRRLELADAVIAVCGKIGVTQSTVDIYQVRLQNLSLERYGGGSISVLPDGKLRIIEHTNEQRENARAAIALDIDWLAQNVDVLPARPLNDPPPVFRRLDSLLGTHFFDEVYAASSANRVLLVDDLFTRRASSLLHTPATWLQPVLMVALKRGILSLENYAKAITDLADIGQEFLSIDARSLFMALKLDQASGQEAIGRRFKVAAKILGGKHADPGSHFSVAASFLDYLWSSHVIRTFELTVTSYLLDQLLKGRTEDYSNILDALDYRFAHREAFRIYLREWAKGHFLEWPARS